MSLLRLLPQCQGLLLGGATSRCHVLLGEHSAGQMGDGDQTGWSFRGKGNCILALLFGHDDDDDDAFVRNLERVV
jgi:hypothetical protein